MGYQAPLDGLRAVSVVAVMLYHGGFGWLHGGFLGVEVFFVISGYLITVLLIEERRGSGTIAARRVLDAARSTAAPGAGDDAGDDCHLGRRVRVARPAVADAA